VLAGLDTAAVAAILGKSPGAVRVALHRGLRVLASDPAVQALALEAAGLRVTSDAASTAPVRRGAVKLLTRRAAALRAHRSEVVDL